MVDYIKTLAQIDETKERDFAGVKCQKYFVGNVGERRLRGMQRTKTILGGREKVVGG